MFSSFVKAFNTVSKASEAVSTAREVKKGNGAKTIGSNIAKKKAGKALKKMFK